MSNLILIEINLEDVYVYVEEGEGFFGGDEVHRDTSGEDVARFLKAGKKWSSHYKSLPAHPPATQSVRVLRAQVQTLLHDEGISQGDFSHMLGWSGPAMSNWLASKRLSQKVLKSRNAEMEAWLDLHHSGVNGKRRKLD